MAHTSSTNSGWRQRIDEFAAVRPDFVLFAPFMSYLLLMAVQDFAFPDALKWVGMILKVAGALLVFELLRKHLPPLGKPYVLLAVIVGVLSAAMWAAGQHWLTALGIPVGLPGLSKLTPDITDPHTLYGDGPLFVSTVTLRILIACTAVPIVEELFWRGFLLRAIIRWDDFEKVPLGQFSWAAFLGTALLSVAQHPAAWEVSIVCWLIFNGLYYYTRSVNCLIITHAVTNLVLYVYMIAAQDWMFW